MLCSYFPLPPRTQVPQVEITVKNEWFLCLASESVSSLALKAVPPPSPQAVLSLRCVFVTVRHLSDLSDEKLY